ncbi:hypothetical protein UFOVP249_48 [uncultured Caudovirales phage]|uniref:Uncharacterized protein n=1 Tax=uncultured Caudovirales phage TaxID=2100421 RepID=A0A6J5LIM5_9CAUD|nr:hypothetical protein UFOVP249_48 [uncultured Caudovirales phage]
MPSYGSLEKMFQKELNDPNETLGQQYSYLKDLGMVPKMSFDYLSPGVEGQYNNWENNLKVSYEAGSPINAFSHELQHAVDAGHARNFSKIKSKGIDTQEERQFIDALKKLDEPTKIPLGDLNQYRSARNERQAYGVANSNYRGGEYRGTPHLDTTEATQQAILLDLARRARKGVPPVKIEPKVDYVDKAIQAPIDLIRSMFSK